MKDQTMKQSDDLDGISARDLEDATSDCVQSPANPAGMVLALALSACMWGVIAIVARKAGRGAES
jgi:hypothetical protein